MENEIIQQLDVIAKNIQALAEPKFIEYIALIFSFIGIIVSGIAIWFAVQVPKKIADRQDNIALFEKRYNVYYLFADFRALSLYIVNTKDRISIQKFFLSSYNITWSNDKNDNAIKVSSQCALILSQMFQSKFLFNESIGMEIAHFSNLVINVITFSLDDNKTAELEQAQKILMMNINKNEKYMWILNQMESYLEITK